MSPDRLKILLVEDDELFRLGLVVRLQREPSIDRLVEAEDGETALDLAKLQLFDLVLLDIGLPGLGGIETCRQLRQQHPQLPILVLTSRHDRALISRLVAAGARGYCLKGVSAETLVLAMRSVVAGASWWDATATADIQIQFQSPDPIAAQVATLTPREREILQLIADRKADREIAELLYIAPGTVRVHVHAILHKLSAPDRHQAVALARQYDLLAAD